MTYSRRLRFISTIARSALLIFALIGGNFLTPTTTYAAATYYVDATSGSDTNTGTSTSTPWKTLSKVNTFLASTSHVAGDTILFKRGETFYATPGASAITLTKNGTSSARITLGAYGTGNKPVISGMAPITSGWTSVGTNLWEITAPTNVNNMSTMVINGTVMPLGRWPKATATNGGYATMTYNSTTGANKIFSAPTGSLSGFGDLAGAEVVVRPNHWTQGRGTISSVSGDTITLVQQASTYGLKNNLGFFIQNSPNILTQNGEWAYVASTGKIRLYYAGTPPTVLISAVDKLVSLGGFDYVNISNLSLEGAKYNAVDGNAAAFITLDSNDIKYSGQFAVYFNGGNDVAITNNAISESQNVGVFVRSASGNNFTVSYNTLVNTGIRMGTIVPNTTGNNLDGMSISANSMNVEGNVIDGTGDNGIRWGGNNLLIKRNIIRNFNQQLDDGGGLYTYGGSNTVTNPSVTQYTNRVITENIIYNGVGAPYGTSSTGRQSSGIYLDLNANHVEVTNNTVFDVPNKGMPLNGIQNVKIAGNNFFNTQTAGLGICRWINDGSQTVGGQDYLGNTITNNALFSVTEDQDMVTVCDQGVKEANPTNVATYPDKLSAPTQTVQSRMASITDPAKGGFNGNIYRSIKLDPISISVQDTTNGPFTNLIPMNVTGWNKISGHDAAAVVVPVTKHIINSTIATLLNTPVDTLTGITSSGSTSTLSLDTTGQITGANSAKITVVTPPSPAQTNTKAYTVWAGLNAPITSTKKYLVRFKTRGTTENGSVKVSLYRKSGTWAYLTPVQYSPFGTGVTQHELMFTGATPSGTGVNGSVLIELLEASGTTYIDDIQVSDVDATILDPNANVVFEYNDTTNPKTVTLPAGIYYNVRDAAQATPIVGSVTIPAFSSVILVKPIGTADTTAPTVSLTSPVASSTLTGTATLAATATDNAGITKVDFYQGTTLVGTSTTLPYTTAWNTTTVANGTYVLKAIATDTSGNTATSPTTTVTVTNTDTTAPTVALTAPAAGTVTGTISLAATASDNIGVAAVDFYYGTTLIGTDTTSPYSATWNTTTVANGAYVLKAVATDAAGNSASSTTVSVTVANADTTAPTVSITSPVASSTLSGTATIAATASDNIGVASVSFYQGTTLIGTDTTAPYTATWNTTAVANGSYSLKAIATDTANNQTASALVTVTVTNADTTAPTVSLTSPTAGTVTGTVTLAATAADNIGVSSVAFYYGTTLISSDSVAPYTASIDSTLVANGSYILKAIATDAAGNATTSNTVTVTVNNPDIVAPTVTLTAPTAGTVSGTATLAATASDNIAVASVDFFYGTTLINTDTTAPYNATWNTTTVANGSYILKAIARDAAGNSGASSTITVTVANADITAPAVTLTSPSSGSASGTISLAATASDNIGVAAVDFYYGTTLIGTDTTSPYSATWNTATVTNGAYVLKAVARDAAGNATTSNTVTVTVANTVADTIAPVVALTSPVAGSILSGTVTMNATASDNVGVARVDLYVGSSLMASDTTAPYTATWNTVASTNGNFRVKAIAYDAAGNSAQSDYIVTVSNTAASIGVSITSPITGATVSGTIAMTATTTGSNITKVEFYRDGSTTPFATAASSYTIFFDTTVLTNGTHTFTAMVYNSTGTTATSSPVSLVVSNTTGGGGGSTAGTPDAPTSVLGQAGYRKAKVSWSAPASNGGSAITSYSVVASPSGATVSTTASPAIVTGLTSGTAYTFSVRANNSVGAGALAVSNATTPVETFATGSQVVATVSSTLNVRRSAGGGSRVGTVTNGTVGTVLGSSSGWTQVQFPGVTGWVSNSYIFSR